MIHIEPFTSLAEYYGPTTKKQERQTLGEKVLTDEEKLRLRQSEFYRESVFKDATSPQLTIQSISPRASRVPPDYTAKAPHFWASNGPRPRPRRHPAVTGR